MNHLRIITIFLFFVINIIPIISINYLTQKQWSSIKYILNHPCKTEKMTNTIQQVIFQHYKHWAFKKAYEYKNKYYTQCKHIPYEELKIYASKGLFLAIKNYNTSYSFSKYASTYIDGQLFYGLSEMHPITPLSITKRINKKWRLKNNILYKKFIKTNLIGDNIYYYNYCKNDYLEDKKKISYEEYVNILSESWNIIDNLDPISKRIMKYRYNYYFEKIRTNEHVGELMCYSDEFVRRKIMKIKNIVKHELQKENLV